MVISRLFLGVLVNPVTGVCKLWTHRDGTYSLFLVEYSLLVN